jgi:circadian clock protein KaiC
VENNTSSNRVRRIASGIPGLDPVLGGGFVENNTYLVLGEAGTGKTVFAAQIAFAQAATGRRSLYITLLAESHGKLVQHLGELRFFEAGRLGQEILILSGYQALSEGALSGLLEFLSKVIREHRPSLLIIDGFHRVIASKPDLEAAAFILDLSSLLASFSCTGLLLSMPVKPDMAAETMVDGIIHVRRERSDMRVARSIEISKARASDHLLGSHSFCIRDSGVEVHPRLEAISTRRTTLPVPTKRRVSFGVQNLDVMMEGGVGGGSATLVAGPAGAGKTILSLHFLATGLKERESCIYFGFHETPDRIAARAEAVGLDITGLHMLWQPPLEYSLDELAYRLLDACRRFSATRVAIDAVSGFRQAALVASRFPMFMTALITELKAENITTVITQNRSSEGEFGTHLDSQLSDNIIHLRYFDARSQLHRLISVLKTRDSNHDTSIRECYITNRGLEVAETFHSAQRALADDLPDTPQQGGT